MADLEILQQQQHNHDKLFLIYITRLQIRLINQQIYALRLYRKLDTD